MAGELAESIISSEARALKPQIPTVNFYKPLFDKIFCHRAASPRRPPEKSFNLRASSL